MNVTTKRDQEFRDQPNLFADAPTHRATLLPKLIERLKENVKTIERDYAGECVAVEVPTPGDAMK